MTIVAWDKRHGHGVAAFYDIKLDRVRPEIYHFLS